MVAVDAGVVSIESNNYQSKAQVAFVQKRRSSYTPHCEEIRIGAGEWRGKGGNY